MNRVLLMIASVLSLSFIACNFAQAGGPVSSKTISGIYTYADGTVRVKFAEGHGDPDSCGSLVYAFIPGTTDKNMYATLLASYISEKKVSLYVNGCLNYAGVKAAKIHRLSVE